METKSIVKSKTFWANIILAVLGCVTVFNEDLLKGFGLGEHAVQNALTILGGVATILNIILRFISNTPITPIVKK